MGWPFKQPGGGYGKTPTAKGVVHVLDETSPVATKELVDSMLKVFRRPDYRPPTLPRVGLELLELSRQADIEFSKVLALLEMDPMIASRVLARSQSSSNASVAPISSLYQALVRLGTDQLTQIVLEESTALTLFRVKGYDRRMEQLRQHSVAVARAARVVCRRTALPDDQAFLCGLLHDVGISACLMTLAHGHRRGRRALPWEKVAPAIIEGHEEAIGLLAEMWNLPPEIALVLGHHHKLSVDGHIHPMIAVLHLAEDLASALGYGDFNELNLKQVEAARRELNLDHATWCSIAEDAAEVLSDIS